MTMSSGVGWLAFSALAQAKSGIAAKAPHYPARAKRVIFLTMRGGPSHVDLFDYKPELMARDGKTASLGRDSSGAKLFGPVRLFTEIGAVSGYQTGRFVDPVALSANKVLYYDTSTRTRGAYAIAGVTLYF